MKNEAYLQEEIAGKYAFYYVGTLFGYFYQECLLAEDRFKKEDFVKNAFFFRQSVKLKGFFCFSSYESAIRASKGAVPFFISTFL